MVVPYGTNIVTDVYPTQTVSNIDWQNFWRTDTGTVLAQSDWVTSGPACAGNLGCPASDPDGFGSVKAVHSVELPECSSGVDIQNTLFGAFQSEVTSAFSCIHGEFPKSPPLPCGFGTFDITPTIVSLNATSYLNHVDQAALDADPVDVVNVELQRPGDDDGVNAGVLVGGQIHVTGTTDNTCGFDWEPCDVTFVFDEQFAIDANGYFQVVPHQLSLTATNGSLCNGFSGFVEGLKDDVHDLFETTVPYIVHGIAKDRQKIAATGMRTGWASLWHQLRLLLARVHGRNVCTLQHVAMVMPLPDDGNGVI
jgi:hypothetical protein